MDFQLSLLQNEIEHLHKNMGLMSEQVCLLKEFIQQEFSNQFEAFSNARKDKKRSTATTTEPSSSGVTHFVEIKTEPELEPDIQEFLDGGTFQESGEESDEEEFGVHPQQKSSRRGQLPGPRNGKPKAMIRKYFESIPTPDGKMQTRCYTCREFVSNKVERLKKHFEKCSSGNKPAYMGGSKVAKRCTAVGLKQSTTIGREEAGVKMGRKLDKVRELFEQVQDSESGSPKMKCLKCEQLVSNKAERLRNHVEKCQGPEGTSEPSSTNT